jgi:hypothetical protein
MAGFANLETLPGADLVKRGTEDLDGGRESAEKGDAAHSAYNALLRRLVSFERAAACAS